MSAWDGRWYGVLLDDLELNLSLETLPFVKVTTDMAFRSGVIYPVAYFLLPDLRGSCGLQEQSNADMALVISRTI